MDNSVIIDIRSILPDDRVRHSRNKPAYCAFPVIGIPWEIISLATCELALQKRDLVGASIRLLEVNVTSTSSIRITVRRPSAFLFFILRGQVDFRDAEEQLLSSSKASAYFLVYCPVGKFFIHLDQGEHSLLIIGLDKHWFLPAPHPAYPAFVPWLKLWEEKARTPLSLSQKEISVPVWRTLAFIRTAVVGNMDDRLKVLSYISTCINHYHNQLLDQKEVNRKITLTQAKQLRAHLSRIYPFDEECRLESIEEKLGWTSWTLRVTAKKALGTPIGVYIQKLRIQKAAQLLRTTERQVREISTEVGFSSPSVFIRAFKKIKGVTPIAYRVKHGNASTAKKKKRLIFLEELFFKILFFLQKRQLFTLGSTYLYS